MAKKLFADASFCKTMSRPAVLICHVVLIVLVTNSIENHRQWNIHRQGLRSLAKLPKLDQILPCQEFPYSFCCTSNRSSILEKHFSEALDEPRDLKRLDLALLLSSAAILLCLAGYVVEYGVNLQIRPTGECHSFINTVAWTLYGISLYFLGRGIGALLPTHSLTLGKLCDDLAPTITDVETKILFFCNKKTGACPNRDDLIITMICSLLLPLVAFGVYLTIKIAGCCIREPKLPTKTVVTKPICFASTFLTAKELPSHVKNVPSAVRLQVRQEFRQMLNALHLNPAFRFDSMFLKALSTTFRNYIRCGYFPRTVGAPLIDRPLMTTNIGRNPQLSLMAILHNSERQAENRESDAENDGFPAAAAPSTTADVRRCWRELGQQAPEDSPPAYEDVAKNRPLRFETYV